MTPVVFPDISLLAGIIPKSAGSVALRLNLLAICSSEWDRKCAASAKSAGTKQDLLSMRSFVSVSLQDVPARPAKRLNQRDRQTKVQARAKKARAAFRTPCSLCVMVTTRAFFVAVGLVPCGDVSFPVLTFQARRSASAHWGRCPTQSTFVSGTYGIPAGSPDPHRTLCAVPQAGLGPVRATIPPPWPFLAFGAVFW